MKLALATGATLLALIAIYQFFVSAGLFTRIPATTGYYDLLANGFLNGHLYLSRLPPAELLAKADPYAKSNSDLWFWDATLYRGKYYLYWGPVPALLAAGVKLVVGRQVTIGDHHLGYAFVIGRLLLGTALLRVCAISLAPRLSRWLIVPAIVVFALCNPYPFDLARVSVYEAAIEGGQFFLLAGLLLGFLALATNRSRSSARALWALAGASWVLAVGCRVSLVFAAIGLVVVSALLGSLGSPRFLRRALSLVICVGVPVLIGGVLLAWYNHARFGAWTEFGTSYQLETMRLTFGAARVLPNLHAYALRRFLVDCKFPFVNSPFGAVEVTPRWAWAEGRGYFPLEPNVGMIVAAPCVLFGAIAVAVAVHQLLALRAQAARHPTVSDIRGIWFTGACLSVGLLAEVPLLGMPASTMRYLADFTSAWLLLAAVGYWAAIDGVRTSRLRRFIHLLGAMLGTYTVLCGVLLGLQGGYYGSFQHQNPALWARMARLSVCK